MMEYKKTELQKQIESGKRILVVEMSPPQSGDPTPLLAAARCLVGKVHALGISDNQERVCMSALAAASLVNSEGIEPILHVVTRDQNRIALVSTYLGAQGLGIGNVLCTSGKHQILGDFRAARNVYDIDSIQLLQTYAGLANDASIIGAEGINGAAPLCLGAVASPYADPLDIQVLRLAKKVSAGAKFLITQPIFDIDRFETWWNEITRRGIHEQSAIIAGIRPLIDASEAEAYASRSPCPMVPEALLERIASKSGKGGQRSMGIEIALETIERLSSFSGLRGFEICADGDSEVALDIIEKSKLRID
ncbi:MAG: methylenetetrahydrofolate reductase [Planctomycetota bacterium]|nr:MAG: methylenetetrahydrofolate reductase [Planctomycetota bacterium]